MNRHWRSTRQITYDAASTRAANSSSQPCAEQSGPTGTLYRSETLTRRIAQLLDEYAVQVAVRHGMHRPSCTRARTLAFRSQRLRGLDLAAGPGGRRNLRLHFNIRKDGGRNYPAVAAAVDGRSQRCVRSKLRQERCCFLRPQGLAPRAAGTRQGAARRALFATTESQACATGAGVCPRRR